MYFDVIYYRLDVERREKFIAIFIQIIQIAK